jgi:hypothetical protein
MTDLTTTTAQILDGILEALAEQAEQERRAAVEQGDAEGALLTRNHARAYTKARFHAARPGAWRQMPNGDLLALSSQAGGVVYTVRRAPRRGDGMTPIVCSCDHGQKSDAIGICWHAALFIAVEQFAPATATERDEAAGPLPFDADHDPEFASLLALEAPAGGDWYEAEHAAAERNYGRPVRRAMAA